MTAEELTLIPDDGYQYELVKGVLRQLPLAGFRSSNLAARLAAQVGSYCQAHGLGEITGADGGYELESDPDTVLAPDVAFVRADRIPSPEDQERFPPVIPDLVVEVVSPSDRMRDVNDKIDLYLALGVPLLWLFHPRRRTVTVHRPHQEPRVLRDSDVLDGEEILPGFRLPLADVFR